MRFHEGIQIMLPVPVAIMDFIDGKLTFFDQAPERNARNLEVSLCFLTRQVFFPSRLLLLLICQTLLLKVACHQVWGATKWSRLATWRLGPDPREAKSEQQSCQQFNSILFTPINISE